ncbi:MAG: TonB-dependent receptor plug domain-containing protein [Candidatus Delongbacteria bacterium]|nr:TonB-dependent receptor plug domain-containing protein [Candidatus Delongbacteria bacterium]MBN2834728.1 TonB-dependent receptor plug domain-containing protein [Candidatus Delongbacteria bacterium]
MKKLFVSIILIIVFNSYSQDQTNFDQLFGMSFEELLNLDISLASKKSELLFESPLASFVLTKEEISKYGVQSVEECFKLIPGVIVREKTNGNYDIHLRGFENIPPTNDIFYTENTISLVMVNGTPVYNYFQGGTYWENVHVSVDDIERIEIIRGPSSALYGPNAVSGVINIITTKHNKYNLTVNSQASNTKDHTGGLTYSDKFGRFWLKFRSNYSANFRDDQDIYNYRLKKYIPSADISIDDRNKYFEDLEMSKEKMYLANTIGFDLDNNDFIALESVVKRSKSLNVINDFTSYGLNTRQSNEYFIKSDIKIMGFESDLSFASGTNDNTKGIDALKFDYNNYTFNIEYNNNYNKLYYRLGYSFYKSVFDDTDYSAEQGYFNDQVSHENSGLHIRFDYKFNNKFRFINAYRYDIYNNPKDHYLSFQLGGTYQIDDSNLLRAIYSRANQGPFIFVNNVNYDYTFFDDDDNIYRREIFKSNKDLKLVVMDNAEFGWRSRFSQKFKTDLEFFYMSTDGHSLLFETSEFDSASNTKITTKSYKNISLNAIQIGTTFDAKYLISKDSEIHVFGTFQRTFLKNFLKLLISGEQNKIVFTDIEHKYTPKFYGGFGYNYLLSDLITFSVMSYYKSPQESSDGINLEKISERLILDLMVKFHMSENIDFWISTKDLSFSSEREFINADEISSSINLGFKYRF